MKPRRGKEDAQRRRLNAAEYKYRRSAAAPRLPARARRRSAAIPLRLGEPALLMSKPGARCRLGSAAKRRTVAADGRRGRGGRGRLPHDPAGCRLGRGPELAGGAAGAALPQLCAAAKSKSAPGKAASVPLSPPSDDDGSSSEGPASLKIAAFLKGKKKKEQNGTMPRESQEQRSVRRVACPSGCEESLMEVVPPCGGGEFPSLQGEGEGRRRGRFLSSGLAPCIFKP